MMYRSSRLSGYLDIDLEYNYFLHAEITSPTPQIAIAVDSKSLWEVIPASRCFVK